MSSHSDVLSALAAGLAADAPESGRKSLKVIRARSPDLVRLSEGTGEDLIATSADRNAPINFISQGCLK